MQLHKYSWVSASNDSGFGVNHLPFGVFTRGGTSPHPAVRIGDFALDLRVLTETELLTSPVIPRDLFAGPTLNPFLAAGHETWAAVRTRVTELLGSGNTELKDAGFAERALVPLHEVEMVLPVTIGDYVDFYSSLEHATNLGRMFRPNSEPLLPNWRHLPVGYHGRASSIVVSGSPIVRPSGQIAPSDGNSAPSFAPSRQLDIELELGFVTGPGNRLGSPIPIAEADQHIFGVVLVNDWSARDIQRWEYQPLGPFLGKSFATSISPWITPLTALEPFRVRGPEQDPRPLEYLQSNHNWAFDIDLEIALVAANSNREDVISTNNTRDLYWNMAQQLAHVSANGTNIRPGDLYASGTISGSGPDSQGSLIELTWAGREPLQLPNGEQRVFLQDGDTVIIRGRSGNRSGSAVKLGAVAGTVIPAI